MVSGLWGPVSAILGNGYEIICNTIPIKSTMILYMAQSRYPLNIQILVIFFPFATSPAMPQYLEITDRYSPQYGVLSFSFHLRLSSPPHLHPHLHPHPPPPPPPHPHPPNSTSFLNHTASPIHDSTIPDLADKISVAPSPLSLSHSPNLCCVGA